MIEIPVGDQIQPVVLKLKGGNDDSGSGGVNVIDQNLRLHGDVSHLFRIQRTFKANRFIHLRFKMVELLKVKKHNICFFENSEGTLVELGLINRDIGYCMTIEDGSISVLNGSSLKRGEEYELSYLNLALGKLTMQSSTFGHGTSEGAVNGKIDQIFNYDLWESNSVIHTLSEMNPWWEVDLGGDYILRKMDIYPRIDPYDGDLSNFTVYVSSSNSTFVHQFDVTDAKMNGSIIVVDMNNIIGSKVRIQLNGRTERVLCLAEVQIFGNTRIFDVAIGQIFNLPETILDQVQFIQEKEDFADPTMLSMDGTEVTSTMFRDVSFYPGDSKDIIVSSYSIFIFLEKLPFSFSRTHSLRMMNLAYVIDICRLSSGNLPVLLIKC